MSDIVKKALAEFKLNLEILTFDESTKTASDAAKTINCEIGQIVKSLIFKTEDSQKPILILTSGVNKVNEKKAAKLIGEKIVKADADFVKNMTGFPIGGVPPIGHKNNIKVYMDKDLLNYNYVWAAAGTLNSVFKISTQILIQITNAEIICVK